MDKSLTFIIVLRFVVLTCQIVTETRQAVAEKEFFNTCVKREQVCYLSDPDHSCGLI